MKIKIITLLLATLFLASCSSSRYGYMPKGKKNKAVVAKKSTKKQPQEIQELASIQHEIPAAINTISEVTPQPIPAPNSVAVTPKKSTEKTILSAPSKTQKIKEVFETLKPNTIKKEKASTETQEVAKGSWLWYVLVGLILALIGGLLPVLGWIFYVVGVVLIIIGLFMLLGLI